MKLVSYTEYIKRAERSFLTHTVQMKPCNQNEYQADFIFLLNPHGSDETLKIERYQRISMFFLTHTVQMKPISFPLLDDTLMNFLTHTVQMKLMRGLKLKQAWNNFLTHTVQMKLAYNLLIKPFINAS